MRAYGVRRKDAGCCPGHDKYPHQPYNMMSRRSFKRWDKHRKTAERLRTRRDLRQQLRESA